MRLVIASGMLLAAAADPLLAADVPATSRIEAVTVYPSGAELRRVAKVKLDEGAHVVIFNDLPEQAVAGSIRVEGKATGKLEIGAVDSRRVLLPRSGAEVARTERKRIEDDIERLKDERTTLQGRIETAEVQKGFIKNLTELPTRGSQSPMPGQPAAKEDWPQILSLIGSSMTDVQRTAQEAQLKIREIDRRIKELEKDLGGQAPPLEERTEVKVYVQAQGSLEAELVVRYQVPNASWSPFYDARLATGAKNVAPRLTLTRRATITQRTGEPWRDVALTLSTTRPAANASAPDIQPITVDYPPERPVVADEVQARRKVAAETSPATGYGMTRGIAPPAAAPLQVTTEQDAIVDVGTFQATFGVPARVTIENTGEAKRVQIDDAQIEPTLVVRAVPKREERAFLYAKVTLPKSAPYLAGPVSLFRDQTFVGTGQMPQLSGGEDYELGFGADDAVRIRYSVAEEKRGETGLISSSRTDQRNYRLVVKNMHERPVAVTILDQIPTSLNQDIKVELIGRSTPTKRDVDDKRGVLAWEDKLGPDEERVIEFGYRITWPSGKNIVFKP